MTMSNTLAVAVQVIFLKIQLSMEAGAVTMSSAVVVAAVICLKI